MKVVFSIFLLLASEPLLASPGSNAGSINKPLQYKSVAKIVQVDSLRPEWKSKLLGHDLIKTTNGWKLFSSPKSNQFNELLNNKKHIVEQVSDVQGKVTATVVKNKAGDTQILLNEKGELLRLYYPQTSETGKVIKVVDAENRPIKEIKVNNEDNSWTHYSIKDPKVSLKKTNLQTNEKGETFLMEARPNLLQQKAKTALLAVHGYFRNFIKRHPGAHTEIFVTAAAITSMTLIAILYAKTLEWQEKVLAAQERFEKEGPQYIFQKANEYVPGGIEEKHFQESLRQIAKMAAANDLDFHQVNTPVASQS